MADDSHTNRDVRRTPPGAYEVGYCRPPVHTRIKLGEIRNPRGRQKGQRNHKTVLLEIANEKVKVKEGNRTRWVTRYEAICRRMTNDALMGNAKAQAILLQRLDRIMSGPEVASPHHTPISSDDEALVADFLARHRDTPRGDPEGSE